MRFPGLNKSSFSGESRRVSRIAKKNRRVKSIEEYREWFAENIVVSISALNQGKRAGTAYPIWGV